VELQFLLAAVPRKTDAQLLRLAQMRQTRSLPFAQGSKVPLRHRSLHVSGNSAAVESFAGSDHDGKYVFSGVLTYEWPAARELQREGHGTIHDGHYQRVNVTPPGILMARWPPARV
jgi:hypothetical protein